jgi:hypothetical protein
MTATHIGIRYVQRSLLPHLPVMDLDRRAQQITYEVGCECLPSTIANFGTYMPRYQVHAVFRVRFTRKNSG